MGRLESRAVTEDQRLLPLVPERHGEHAAEPPGGGLAPLLPRVRDHLGVALSLEAVPETGELGAERLEVVELSVEHRSHAPILGADRLVAARDVDDAESTGSQDRMRGRKEAVLVGAAVGERGGHAADQSLRDGSVEAGHPRDAAHQPPSR